MNSIISIKSLTKYYGKFLAVSDISFSVNKGEIFGLIGPNDNVFVPSIDPIYIGKDGKFSSFIETKNTLIKTILKAKKSIKEKNKTNDNS